MDVSRRNIQSALGSTKNSMGLGSEAGDVFSKLHQRLVLNMSKKFGHQQSTAKIIQMVVS